MKRVYLIITMALTMLISVPVGYTQSPFNLPERDQDEMALEYTLQRFNHIEDVLNTCPQNDPYYGTIRSQFVIRRNGIWVGDIPCTEPVSEIPISQYSDELITLQALRAALLAEHPAVVTVIPRQGPLAAQGILSIISSIGVTGATPVGVCRM
jgi:hypothetical protein